MGRVSQKKFNNMKKNKNHGGTRPSAGRPLKGKEKRVRINVSIDSQDLKILDDKRGEKSRGDFIGEILKVKIEEV